MRRILIDDKEKDLSKCSYNFPWRRNAICYNFGFPNEMVLADKINELTNCDEVMTVVIGSPLADYNFLKQFTNLEQLYIYESSNLKSLSFIEELVKLKTIYIRKSDYFGPKAPVLTMR